MIKRWLVVAILVVLLSLVWTAGGSAAVVVSNFHLSLTPDGVAMTRFPSGIDTIYVVFDYADAEDTPIRVTVWDDWGKVLLEDERRYTGSGHQIILLTATPGFEDTRPGQTNVATIYVDDYPAQSIEWTVGPAEPTPTPTPPAEVPEATTFLLIGSGLAGLAGYARLRLRARRRR